MLQRPPPWRPPGAWAGGQIGFVSVVICLDSVVICPASWVYNRRRKVTQADAALKPRVLKNRHRRPIEPRDLRTELEALADA